MTTKTRYFFLGGTAVLVAGLAGGLAAYYAGVPVFGALSGEPEALHFVPEDAAVVAFADVHAVMDSELRKQIRQVQPEGASQAETNGRRIFEEHTGVDIERDIDQVVAYLLPAADQGGPEQGLVLATGRFDQPRIERLIQDHGGVAETYLGKQFLVRRFDIPVPPPAPPIPSPDSQTPSPQSLVPGPTRAHEMAVGFIRPDLIAVGTSAALRRAIDLQSGNGLDITRNDEFMVLVRDSDDGNAWAVGRFDRLVSRGGVPQEIISRLPPLTYLAASGHVNGGLRGRLRVEARDETSAQQLHDVIRGFVALAKMQSGSRPELATVLQSLQLQAEGNSVVLSFALPAEVIQTLASQNFPRPPQ
jgi:hypothetical protein